MCRDKLYLHQHFIQNRFIDGNQGQRFTFEDNVIVNLMDLVQTTEITPEVDMYIKIKTKEAYGINMKMKVCHEH